jgi:uncharacterized Zn finger protein
MARYYGEWAPYVSVAERRKKAAKKVTALQKKGQIISPVHIEGRAIARTFWGKSWCDNLEAYSDFSNRLPRGRTYVRNGSVIDLQIAKGLITAMVSGSSIYTIKITIRALEQSRWKTLIQHCSGKIDSLVELLQGKLSQGVMEVITCKERGLFPSPQQISMNCSCPDSAVMCKHVAAVLYGIGARLDEKPELFFELRNVDQAELITAAASKNTVTSTTRSKKVLQSTDLSGLFGIELEGVSSAEESKQNTAKKKKKTTLLSPKASQSTKSKTRTKTTATKKQRHKSSGL